MLKSLVLLFNALPALKHTECSAEKLVVAKPSEGEAQNGRPMDDGNCVALSKETPIIPEKSPEGR